MIVQFSVMLRTAVAGPVTLEMQRLTNSGFEIEKSRQIATETQSVRSLLRTKLSCRRV